MILKKSMDLEKFFDETKKRKILVVGDLILDKFTWGEIERVNPEQPAAPLVKKMGKSYALGGAGNVARNIVSLGAKCSLYGILGNDEFGKQFEELCVKKGVKLNGIYGESPTITKQRIMAHGQQIVRIDMGEDGLEKINSNLEEKLMHSLKKEIPECDFIILSDYDKQIFQKNSTKKIIELAKKYNVATLVDPKPCNLDFFKGCTVICPNKHEAEKMTEIKYSNGKSQLTKMGEALSKRVNAKYVIITCSEDGMFSYDDEKKNSIFVETKAKEVSDVTGAGDTFAATLTLGLASKLNIHDSAKIANYAAGIVVGKVGTATCTKEELKEAFEGEM